MYAVAEQRERVHRERHERGQRERLVDDAQVLAPAHPAAQQEPHRHRGARGQQGGDARGAARDPEEVLGHDWLVESEEPSSSTTYVSCRSIRRRSAAWIRSTVVVSVTAVCVAVDVFGAHRSVPRDGAPEQDEGREDGGEHPLADRRDTARAGGEEFLGGGHALEDRRRLARADCEEPEKILGMVLFDLDGVLVDSRAAFLNSMALALTDLELPSFTRERAAALHRPAARRSGSPSCWRPRPRTPGSTR